jgi:hypothetical protein
MAFDPAKPVKDSPVDETVAFRLSPLNLQIAPDLFSLAECGDNVACF